MLAALAGQIGNLGYLAIAWTRYSSAGNGNVIGSAAEVKS
jgi:hypothetical protein